MPQAWPCAAPALPSAELHEQREARWPHAVQRRRWWPCVSPHPRCPPSPAFSWLWRVSRAVTAASVSLPQPHSASRRLLLICGYQLEKHPRGPPSSNQGVPELPEGTRAGCSVGMGPHPAWGKERRWHLILGDLQKPPGGGPGHPAMGGPTRAGAGTNDIPSPCQPQLSCGRGVQPPWNRSPAAWASQSWEGFELWLEKTSSPRFSVCKQHGGRWRGWGGDNGVALGNAAARQ